MRPTIQLLQEACRITLFTRPNCSLCTQASHVLGQVKAVRPYKYTEVDIVKKQNQAWKDVYDFDVPVIHLSKPGKGDEDPKLVGKAVKLMHRFTVDNVLSKMDQVEKE